MRSYFSAAQEVDRPTFYILFPTRLWSEEIPEFLDSISHTSISLFDSRISIPPSAGQFLPANDLQNLQISIFSNGTEPFHIVILTPPFEAGFFVKAPDIHEDSSNFFLNSSGLSGSKFSQRNFDRCSFIRFSMS